MKILQNTRRNTSAFYISIISLAFSSEGIIVFATKKPSTPHAKVKQEQAAVLPGLSPVSS